MASNYYKPCAELNECDRLIEEYFLKGQYAECFKGHLRLAEKEYPLAECQTGYFYHKRLGVEKDMKSHSFIRSGLLDTVTETRNSTLQTGFTSLALSLKKYGRGACLV